MNEKEIASKEIEQLVIDLYEKEFSWLPGWVRKKTLKVGRVKKYSDRIMDISEKYVKTVVEKNK